MTLTQRDYDEIERIVGEIVDRNISHLPTKDEFYAQMDEVMGELKAIREGQDILTSKVFGDHEPRITRMEKKLRISPSS